MRVWTWVSMLECWSLGMSCCSGVVPVVMVRMGLSCPERRPFIYPLYM